MSPSMDGAPRHAASSTLGQQLKTKEAASAGGPVVFRSYIGVRDRPQNISGGTSGDIEQTGKT